MTADLDAIRANLKEAQRLRKIIDGPTSTLGASAYRALSDNGYDHYIPDVSDLLAEVDRLNAQIAALVGKLADAQAPYHGDVIIGRQGHAADHKPAAGEGNK